jgi:hypothetical protein
MKIRTILIAVLVAVLSFGSVALAAPTLPTTTITPPPTLTYQPGPITFAAQETGVQLQWIYDTLRLGTRTLMGFHVYRGGLTAANRLTDFPVKDQGQNATGQTVYVFQDYGSVKGILYTVQALYSDGKAETVATGTYFGERPTTPDELTNGAPPEPPTSRLVFPDPDPYNFRLTITVEGHKVDLRWTHPVSARGDRLVYWVSRRPAGSSEAWTKSGALMENRFTDYVATGNYEYMVTARTDRGDTFSPRLTVNVVPAPGPERYITLSIAASEFGGLPGTPEQALIDDFDLISGADGRCQVIIQRHSINAASMSLVHKIEPYATMAIRVWELYGDQYYETQRLLLDEVSVVERRLVYSETDGVTEEYTLSPDRVFWGQPDYSIYLEY